MCDRPLLSASLLAALLAAGIAAAAPSNCKLVRIDEWPVRVQGGQVLVDGAINGNKVAVMLDTGAMRSLMPRTAAAKLGLKLQQTRYSVFGIGGNSFVDVAQLGEFRIGNATRKKWGVAAAGEKAFPGGVGFILGDDFFSQADVEFDLAHNAVRLFQPKDCNDVALAYWLPGEASEVAIERVDELHPQIVVTLLINGQPIRALLDSGAATSILTKSAAARLGVTPDKADVVAVGRMGGVGASTIESWLGRFDSVVIGNEKITDTTLRFGEIYDDSGPRVHPMLLGVDFLTSHRVFVAHSQRKLYFSYVGGPIFQRTGPVRTTPVVPEPSSTPATETAGAAAETK
jgi:predicted aspartyl protease